MFRKVTIVFENVKIHWVVPPLPTCSQCLQWHKKKKHGSRVSVSKRNRSKKNPIGYHHQKGMMEATNNTAMALQHLERLCFVGKPDKMASSMEYNGMISRFFPQKKNRGILWNLANTNLITLLIRYKIFWYFWAPTWTIDSCWLGQQGLHRSLTVSHLWRSIQDEAANLPDVENQACAKDFPGENMGIPHLC